MHNSIHSSSILLTRKNSVFLRPSFSTTYNRLHLISATTTYQNIFSLETLFFSPIHTLHVCVLIHSHLVNPSIQDRTRSFYYTSFIHLYWLLPQLHVYTHLDIITASPNSHKLSIIVGKGCITFLQITSQLFVTFKLQQAVPHS